MEGEGGAAIADIRVREGRRQSIFRSYVYPIMDRPNLTVLTGALVRRVMFEGTNAVGVEMLYDGEIGHVFARTEVVLSLGAIQTPKVLMQSGIGNEAELRRWGVPVVRHLPGVGQNFQDHPGFHCAWEAPEPLQMRNNAAEATLFWKSGAPADAPDLQCTICEFPRVTPDNEARFGKPANGWTVVSCLTRPKSRGQIRLTGSEPEDPVSIEANHLRDPDDFKAAVQSVRLARELGNSGALAPFASRAVTPGKAEGAELERFVRDAASSFYHQSCTAKMGTDEMSVVNGRLEVYGVGNLRVADASIMPRVTTGNTMAPCVVIGERAADILRARHGI
jgi:choline dehydrogenase